jgi:hypothetical protein
VLPYWCGSFLQVSDLCITVGCRGALGALPEISPARHREQRGGGGGVRERHRLRGVPAPPRHRLHRRQGGGHCPGRGDTRCRRGGRRIIDSERELTRR